MSSSKFIPEKVFQIIAATLLIGTITLIVIWTINESGPYAVIARALANDQGIYDATFALALTILITLVPFLVVVLILRQFSKVKTFREQITTDPLLSQLFRTTSPSSTKSSNGAYSKNLRLKRLFAFVIDRALVILFIVITVIPMMIVKETNPKLAVPAMVIALVLVLIGVFYAWARDFYKGKSLARKWLKLRVVDEVTGAPIGAWRSFKRELLLHLAPTLLIELVLLFASPNGRRLGDKWAKTKVIRD